MLDEQGGIYLEFNTFPPCYTYKNGNSENVSVIYQQIDFRLLKCNYNSTALTQI